MRESSGWGGHDSIKTGTRLPETTSSRTVTARLVPPALRPVSPDQRQRRLERWWGSAAWRNVKRVLDAVLIAGVAWAVTWAATNGVFVAQRAVANRAIVQVHIANGALALHELNGPVIRTGIVHTAVRHGERTLRVSVFIENEGPDGIVMKSATLTGPFLTAPAQLAPSGNGYAGVHDIERMTGVVTVDCDAAAPVASALVGLIPLNRQQPPTLVALTLDDADGKAHQETMTLDTTAAALQGQVCVS